MVTAWKLAAMAVETDIILPAPERVFSTLMQIAGTSRFLSALGATALRGLVAFSVSMILGMAFGFAAGTSHRFEALLGPGLTVIRATPVLAVILIALIWFPAGIVPIFSAVVMAFPVVAADVAAGVRSADQRLLAMAHSFNVSKRDISLLIRLPSAMPHVVSAAKNAVGLSWKVVVAGEVLSQPVNALGTGMQNARVMLETAEVFAWAVVGVLLCALSDLAFDLLAGRLTWPTK
jgi:NitT/TauT family transport system permease protein